jgi:hypothetical protein
MENQNQNENQNNDYTLEIYFAGFVFWLSNIMNKIYFCSKQIYEENEWVRNGVDSTVYITEYTCKQCSNKKEEPMEKTWICKNYFNKYNYELNEEYYILNEFSLNKYFDFLDYKVKKTDLIIIKGEFSKGLFHKEK